MLGSTPALLLTPVGCGGSAPEPVTIGASCVSAGGVHVEVEQGLNQNEAGVCWSIAQAVDIYRGTYEERWGPVDLSAWTFRLRTTTLSFP